MDEQLRNQLVGKLGTLMVANAELAAANGGIGAELQSVTAELVATKALLEAAQREIGRLETELVASKIDSNIEREDRKAPLGRTSEGVH